MAKNKIQYPGTALPGFFIYTPQLQLSQTGDAVSFLVNYFKTFTMQPSLRYSNEGRGGSVIYSDTVSSIRFYFELGGGDCVAIIFIPADNNWPKETGRVLSEKNNIVQFVAEQATKDQVGNGRYRITENLIEIYRH